MPSLFFFFNDTATSEIYTLSLHDALPISGADGALPRRRSHDPLCQGRRDDVGRAPAQVRGRDGADGGGGRSEEHTSELQSQSNLVCRLLLEKKNKTLKHKLILKANTLTST